MGNCGSSKCGQQQCCDPCQQQQCCPQPCQKQQCCPKQRSCCSSCCKKRPRQVCCESQNIHIIHMPQQMPQQCGSSNFIAQPQQYASFAPQPQFAPQFSSGAFPSAC